MNTNDLKEAKKTNKPISHDSLQGPLCDNCEKALKILDKCLKSNNSILSKAKRITGIAEKLKSCDICGIPNEKINKMIDEATKEYITPPIPANILYAYEFDDMCPHTCDFSHE